jgi:TonB family protein
VRPAISRATLAVALLVVSGPLTAQEDTRHSYVSDSASERIPLITAFPKYPYVARRDRIEGEAVVCFKISAKGKVQRPTVRRSTHRIFRRPALKAIKQSSFEPLDPGETTSPVKTCRTYRFRLDPVVAENSPT